MGVVVHAQEQSLFGELSVEENLSVGKGRRCPTRRARRGPVGTSRCSASGSRQRAGTLSGGEQKMLTLAKALVDAARPALLDEISDGLGPARGHPVGGALRGLRERYGCTILMVEQNLDLSLEVADRVAVLKLG